jgi:hypothetical protein
MPKLNDVKKIEGVLEVRKERSTVYVEKSVTKNMGNYNSAKVTVGITLYTDPTPEEVREANMTIKVASEIIDKRLWLELDEIERNK